MAVDFHVIEHYGDGVIRWAIGDLLLVKDAVGALAVPNVASPFRIVRVTDLALATAQAWIAAHTDETDPDNPVTLHQRLYWLDPTRMKTSDRNYWNTNRTISATIQEARKWIVNKATGLPQG